MKKSDKQPVPDSIYLCLYMDKDKLVGAVNTQHRLNNKLLLNGGHIGDGVRPSEQEKGIALQ